MDEYYKNKSKKISVEQEQLRQIIPKQQSQQSQKQQHKKVLDSSSSSSDSIESENNKINQYQKDRNKQQKDQVRGVVNKTEQMIQELKIQKKDDLSELNEIMKSEKQLKEALNNYNENLQSQLKNKQIIQNLQETMKSQEDVINNCKKEKQESKKNYEQQKNQYEELLQRFKNMENEFLAMQQQNNENQDKLSQVEKQYIIINTSKKSYFNVLVKMLFKQYDREKTGKLKIGHLDRLICEFFQKLDKPEPGINFVKEIMQKYDKSGTNEIKEKQLKQILKECIKITEQGYDQNLNLKLSDESLHIICEDIFVKCDRKQIGYLTKSECDWAICEFFKQQNANDPPQTFVLKILSELGFDLNNLKVDQNQFYKIICALTQHEEN